MPVMRRRYVAGACVIAAALVEAGCAGERQQLVERGLAHVDAAEERLTVVAEMYRAEEEYFAERRALAPPCPAEAPEGTGMALYNCRWYTEELREIQADLRMEAESYDAEKLDDLLATVRRTIRNATVEDLRSLHDNPPDKFAQQWWRVMHFAWARAVGTPAMDWFAERRLNWTQAYWPSTDAEWARTSLDNARRKFEEAESNLRVTLAALP